MSPHSKSTPLSPGKSSPKQNIQNANDSSQKKLKINERSYSQDYCSLVYKTDTLTNNEEHKPKKKKKLFDPKFTIPIQSEKAKEIISMLNKFINLVEKRFENYLS